MCAELVNFIKCVEEFERVTHNFFAWDANGGNLENLKTRKICLSAYPRHPVGYLTQGKLSHPHRDDGENPPDHLDGGDCGEKDEPEPEHDVDFLVDDVKWQDAESINLLDSSRGSVLVEGAW